MTDFKNNFSWSKSRDQIFKECKRKYYFNHYGFWEGWNNHASEEKKKLYYLKNIKTKEIWIGQVVHETVEEILRQYKLKTQIPREQALAMLKAKLSEQFKQSLTKKYNGFNNKLNKLFEHEYEIEISDEQWCELFDKAKKCIDNFYDSDIFKKIIETPRENWLLLEDFLSFDFEDELVYLSIDFALRDRDKIILYDWKTGKDRNDDFNIQLSCYALYAMERFGVPADKIIAKIYNLSTNTQKDFEITQEKINKTADYMRESIYEMRSLLSDRDENIAKEENFPKTKGYHCERCNFKKICIKEVDVKIDSNQSTL